MKTIYENNLNTLEQHHKTLWEAFSRDSSLEENEFAFATQAKNGEWIVGCHMEGKDNYMNSTYNPAREAEKLMSEYAAMPENAFLCMFGLANGSFARAYLRENGEGVAIYVYEPSKKVFSAVMHNIDITELLADKRFHIVVEPYNADDFAEFLLDYISEANEFTNRYMAIPVYQKVFPESYDHYRQVIRDKYEYYRIQTNTLIKVGKEIGLASVRNMRFLPDCRSGAEYKNYFPEDIPAIIVAAGPSLKKNVDLLKKVKGKAVTIVVDSAINTVMAHGIVPDFAITVDTNKELKNFTAEGLSDVFLLADATANTKVLDMVKSKNLVFYSSDSATWQRMFREEGSSITEVFAGGSVALDAMALAKEWGFKRIIMIGQDLAMTGNKQYADGENLNQNTSFNSPTLYVKDIYGNDVLTKKDYYTFIRSIEDLAYRNPDIDFIDATEGGAFKKHTRIMTLQEAIDTYCTVGYDVTGRIEAVPRLFEEEGKKKVLDNLSLMREHVQTLTDKMAVGAQDCTLAAHMLETGKFDKEVLKKINERNRELDAYYADMEEHILVKKISAQANYDFGKEVYQTLQDDIQESIRLYKNSAKLYQGIADSTDCIIDEIAKVESEITNE